MEEILERVGYEKNTHLINQESNILSYNRFTVYWLHRTEEAGFRQTPINTLLKFLNGNKRALMLRLIDHSVENKHVLLTSDFYGHKNMNNSRQIK